MLRLTAIVLLAAAAATPPDPTAREKYDEGLEKLQAKDLREAEKSLLEAAKTNDEAVQPRATEHLGHVRFLQGKELLSGEGNRQALLDSGAAASAVADEALRSGNDALIGDEDVKTLVNRFNEDRAARKQLLPPRKDSTRELDLLGSALKRWRLSADGFHSTYELEPANTDAKFNGDVVERHIEENLKFKKKIEEEKSGTSARRKALAEQMRKLYDKIPDQFKKEVPPEEGDGDDPEDDEDGKEPQQQGSGDKDGDKDKEGGDKQDQQEKSKGSVGHQRQRLGSDREIDADTLRMLKEKITPRTMSPGNEPSGVREFGETSREAGEQKEPGSKRKVRDW